MWSTSDLIYLKNNFSNMSDIDISKKLNKTIRSVQSMSSKMKLKKDTNYIKSINKFRAEKRWGSLLWSKSDIDFLINNINLLSNDDLSIKLNRSKNSIVSMCISLGIRRDVKYNKKFLEEECLKYITKQELRI